MAQEKIVLAENEITMKFTEEESFLKKSALKNLIKLWQKKDYNNLINTANEALEKLPGKAFGEGDKEIAEIYFLLASAMRESNKDLKVAKKYALKAAEFNRLDKNILWLIRELSGKYSEKTILMRVQIFGKMYRMYNNEEVEDIFKTVYGIAAENEEEAFEFIKEFERREVTQNMKILKAVNHGAKPDLPKGIYETMKLLVWFEKEDDVNKN
ncbi:hypothetical protein ACFLSQ_02920 [Bacteroidota bacterium]